MTNIGATARAKTWTPKRTLMIVLSSTALFLTLAMVATSLIWNGIFTRPDQSQSIFRDYSAAIAQEYPRKAVQFSSGDNTLLGHLYPAKQPHGVVLIAHGLWGSDRSHLSETMYFVDHNWMVFTFDGTGIGSSTGDSLVGLQQMVLDLRAAMAYLSIEPDVEGLPLVLYGHSMGGYASVIAAEDNENVEAVVSISGFNDPLEVMTGTGKRMFGGAVMAGYPFLYLHNKFTFGDDASRTASDAINHSDAAFLIFYGTDDHVVCPEESIYANREAVVNPSAAFYLVEEAPRNTHSGLWLTADAAAYRAEVDRQLQDLQKRYGDPLPQKIFETFYDSLDQQALFDLDQDFMEKVLDFYLEAI